MKNQGLEGPNKGKENPKGPEKVKPKKADVGGETTLEGLTSKATTLKGLQLGEKRRPRGRRAS